MQGRTILIRTGLVGVLIVASAARTRADATVFVGAMTAESPRPAVGVAVGRCPSVFGFEVEYAGTLGAATPTHSSAGGVNGSFMVQSRSPVRGFQFYGIGGFGLYGESGGGGSSGETIARNIGGGAKIRLAGPLRLRLDYRVFLVGAAPDASRGFVVHHHPQRFSVGVSLAF